MGAGRSKGFAVVLVQLAGVPRFGERPDVSGKPFGNSLGMLELGVYFRPEQQCQIRKITNPANAP